MKLSNKLILGSQSPRRKELLEQAGFTFDVERIEVDEVFPDDMPAFDVAAFLAGKKNKAYRETFTSSVILTADTLVISGGKILGKPEDEKEAFKMLSLLSGKTHMVVSGVCISDAEKQHITSSTTEVKVKLLSKKEIEYYTSRFKPFDKAGSYGIQEWFGLVAIERISGSYSNVVGLPMARVYQMLTEEFDVHPEEM